MSYQNNNQLFRSYPEININSIFQQAESNGWQIHDRQIAAILHYHEQLDRMPLEKKIEQFNSLCIAYIRSTETPYASKYGELIDDFITRYNHILPNLIDKLFPHTAARIDREHTPSLCN